MIEYILLLLVVVLAGILGFLFVNYMLYRKQTDEKIATATKTLVARDDELAEQVNTNIDSLTGDVENSFGAITSNVAILTRQVAVQEASGSNMQKYIRFGSNISPSNLALDSNVNINLIQRTVALGGLTIQDLDKANPMKFCFKGTGQCTSIPDKDNVFNFSMPVDFGVTTSNIWFDGAVTVASARDLTFRSAIGSSNIDAGLKFSSNMFQLSSSKDMQLDALTPVWTKPGVRTHRLDISNASGVVPSDGTNVSMRYVSGGAAVVMGSNATLYVSNTNPTLTDTLPSYMMKISTGTGTNPPIVLETATDLQIKAPNVNVTGNLTVSGEIDGSKLLINGTQQLPAV